MQKEENELDRYLKSKVEEAHFEFKEIYWQKALEMLDQEDEKKKRPGLWRWFTLMGVLIVVGVGAFFISNKKTSKKSQNEKTAFVSNENRSPDKHNNTSYQKDSITAVSTIAIVKQPVSEEKANESPITGNSSTSTPKLSPEVKSPKPTPIMNNNQSIDAREHKQTKPEAVAVPNAPNANESPLKKSSQKTRKNGLKPMKGIEGVTKQKEPPVEKMPPAPLVNNTVLLNGKRMQPIDTQVLIQKQYRDESIYNPRYMANLLNYQTERIDSITILTFKPAPEAKQVIVKKEIVSDTSKRKKAQGFFVAAGANFNKGFKGNQNTTVSWGLAPYVNVGIEKMIRSKISLSTHIGFTYFNGLNLEKTSVQYKYSFGFDSTKIAVKYQRMYQLLLPISVAYHIGKLHTLWGGLGASYVFNTESSVTENKTTKNQKGYIDGINRFDIFSMLGYEYQFHKNLTAQTFWQQGYMNAAQKEFFNINSTNTQTRVSLGLKYFFKRNGN